MAGLEAASFTDVLLAQKEGFFDTLPLQHCRDLIRALCHDIERQAGELEALTVKRDRFQAAQTAHQGDIQRIASRDHELDALINAAEAEMEGRANSLAKAIFAAAAAQEIDAGNLFAKKRTLDQNVATLHAELNRPSGEQGFLAVAKATAKKALLKGKIFLAEAEVEAELTRVGKAIIGADQERQYRGTTTSAEVDAVSQLRDKLKEGRAAKEALRTEGQQADARFHAVLAALGIDNPAGFLAEIDALESQGRDTLFQLNERLIDLSFDTYQLIKQKDIADPRLMEVVRAFSEELGQLEAKRDAVEGKYDSAKQGLVIAGAVGMGLFTLVTGGVGVLLFAGAGGLASQQAMKWIRKKMNERGATACLCFRCNNPGPHYFAHISGGALDGVALGMAGGAIAGVLGTFLAKKLFRCRRCGAIITESGKSIWQLEQAISAFRNHPELRESLSKMQLLVAAKDENVKALLLQHAKEMDEIDELVLRKNVQVADLQKRIDILMDAVNAKRGSYGE